MRITFAGALDRGLVRAENQDAIFLPITSVAHKKQIFILADGMGGAKAGGLASQLAVETISEAFLSRPKKETLKVSLLDAVQGAAATINRQAQNDSETSGMGTTVVAVAFEANQAIVANVGDSRCYFLDGKHLRQITHDHSLVQEMLDQGNLSIDEAKQHKYRNVLTRVVGNNPDVEADIFSLELNDGDVLLLCSDGLHGVVDDQEIGEILFGEGDLQSKADQLVALANQKGGPDNISVILLQVDENGSELEDEKVPVKGLPSLPLLGRLCPKWIIRGGVGLALIILLFGSIFWLWPGTHDGDTVSPGTSQEALNTDALAGQAGTSAQESPKFLSPIQPDQAGELEKEKTPLAAGHALADSTEANLKDVELAPGPEKKSSRLGEDISPVAVRADQKFEDVLRTNFYDGKTKVFFQLGAYGSREGLSRALGEINEKLPNQNEARPVWTLTASSRGARLLYKVYLEAPTAKGAKAAVKLLSGIAPLPMGNRPKPLPRGSSFAFKRNSMSRLDGSNVKDAPLAMVLLAGPKMASRQAALAGEIINAGLQGALVVVDAGAGPKITTQMAEAAAKMAGDHQVFLYRGGRIKKRDELVIDRSQLRDFVLAVAKVCPKLSLMPPVSASPAIKMIGPVSR